MQVTVNNITTQVEVQAGYELYEIHVEDYSAESAKNSAIAAALSASNALKSANDAADSAAAALASENAAAADALATASDRAQTGLDRVATGQDRSATAADAIATAADRVQTGLDRVATAADRVQTGLDRVATAADRVQTGTDANVASTQAGVATTQAGIATTQAGIATTQAGIATTQASNALSSANAAAASASNALNSANAAAASAASAAQVGTSTLLTGFATGTNIAIAATDSILAAFNKTQGQINARAVISGTPAAGQVAFWGSASAVAGNANLTWDNNNSILSVRGVTVNPNLYLVNSAAGPDFHGIEFRRDSSVDATIKQHPISGELRISSGRNSSWGGTIAFFTDTTLKWNITATGILQSNGAQTIRTSTGLLSFQNAGGNVAIGTATDAGFRLDVNGTARVQGNLTLTAGANIVLQTATGTRIGTATNQLLSFWNKTPIVQPTTAIAAATLAGSGGSSITSGNTFGGYTIQQIAQALINIGILA